MTWALTQSFRYVPVGTYITKDEPSMMRAGPALVSLQVIDPSE